MHAVPTPPVVATPLGGGAWRLDGHVPWATGWGVLDYVALAGVTHDGQVVTGLLPFGAQPGLRVSSPQALLAMSASWTVSLDLEDVWVTPANMISVETVDAWRVHDDRKNANATPATFGLARMLLQALSETEDGAEFADQLAGDVAACRKRAYALADDPCSDVAIHEERMRVRGNSLHLLTLCSQSLIAAMGGQAMNSVGDPARWAREAMFHLVQGQTRGVRRAILEATRLPAFISR